MTAPLLITLGSVTAWLLGWFITARRRVELWHRRGDRLCVRSELVRERRFSRPDDRGWIAFYALLVTFVWPVMLVCLIVHDRLFSRLDRRVAAKNQAQRRRAAEVQTWRATLRDPAASDVERQVAREVLRGLGVEEVP